MSNFVNHPFHLVDESPWPILAAGFRFGLTTGFIKLFHLHSTSLIFIRLLGLLLVIFQWWRDVGREGSYLGLHSQIVELGLRWGMALFITSEVFFFLSFFWAFFHASLSPNVELGRRWPPIGILPFNPFGVPLLNRIVLLRSGVSVTWCHHALIHYNHEQAVQGLATTIFLGLYFTFLQAIEYWEASFNLRDRVYGSSFFVATGFHGLHVIVGTTFLAVCLWRIRKGVFRNGHHFGLEAAAWYWHFVDVVWLFLYVRIYWWGSLF